MDGTDFAIRHTRFNAEPLSLDMLLPVVRNLRPADVKEIYAMRWEDHGAEPDLLAHDIMANKSTFGFVVGTDHPIAAVGATAILPGAWSAWSFGTPEIGNIILPLTRFALRYIVGTVRKQGATRLECYSEEGHSDAHRWLKVLGAKREQLITGYGRNGEHFWRYVLDLETAGCGNGV